MANPLSNQKVMQKTIGTLILIVFIFLVLAFQAAGDGASLEKISGAFGAGINKAIKKAGNQLAVQAADQVAQAANQLGGSCSPACTAEQVCRNNQCVAAVKVVHYDFTNRMTDTSNNQNEGVIGHFDAQGNPVQGVLNTPNIQDGGKALPALGNVRDFAFRDNFRNLPNDEVTVMFWAKGAPKIDKDMVFFSYSQGNSPQSSSVLQFQLMRKITVNNRVYQRGSLLLKPPLLEPSRLTFLIPEINAGWHHYAVTWRSSSGAVVVFVDGQAVAQNALVESGDLCFDGQDNDFDGSTDCVDTDCANTRRTYSMTYTFERGQRQGRTGTYNPSCGPESDAVASELSCIDGIDNDGNKFGNKLALEIDCREDACYSRDGREPGQSICRRLGKRPQDAPAPLVGMLGGACVAGECSSDPRLICIGGICVTETVEIVHAAAPAPVAPEFIIGKDRRLVSGGTLMLGHAQTHQHAGYAIPDTAYLGFLDEFRMYNKALPADTINSIFSAGRRDPVIAPVIAPTCVDTDIGGALAQQASVKSFATLGDERQDDSCSPDAAKAATVVVERLCLPNQITSMEFDCASLGKVCRDGACVNAPPPQACNADANCGAGLRCFSRVCQTQVCSETDSGNDPATAGILTLDRSITEDIATKDACGDDRMLTEYYCTQNGGSTRQSVACPQGTTCQMNAEQVGACVDAVQAPVDGDAGGEGLQQHQEADDDSAGTSNYFRRTGEDDSFQRR